MSNEPQTLKDACKEAGWDEVQAKESAPRGTAFPCEGFWFWVLLTLTMAAAAGLLVYAIMLLATHWMGGATP